MDIPLVQDIAAWKATCCFGPGRFQHVVMYLIPDRDLKEGLVENEQFKAWKDGVVIVCLFFFEKVSNNTMDTHLTSLP